jgi:translation initiation factor eIF-2B subunit delta
MARRFTDRDNVEVTLVVDSAAGYVLSDCDRVLLGMNCITDEALYNRIGTYPIVATARQERVPVTVVGSSLKMMDTGFSFENQFRSPSEVLLEPTDEFEVANPAYDRTPRALIDQVVTEDSS